MTGSFLFSLLRKNGYSLLKLAVLLCLVPKSGVFCAKPCGVTLFGPEKWCFPHQTLRCYSVWSRKLVFSAPKLAVLLCLVPKSGVFCAKPCGVTLFGPEKWCFPHQTLRCYSVWSRIWALFAPNPVVLLCLVPKIGVFRTKPCGIV